MPHRRDFLSSLPLTAAAALSAAPSPIRPGASRHDLPTPALIVELDIMEANILKMVSHVKAAGRALRPHAKTHKCPEIAKRLIQAGAVGACAAKISEAVALSDGGVGGLLITGAIIGKAKINQALDLCAKRPETILCVDDAANAAELNSAAEARGLRLNVAIDLWVGRRTGIQPGEPALALAQYLDSRCKRLKFAGLQAYAGHAAHTKGFGERKKVSLEAMSGAIETRRRIEQAGIPCRWVSGGSTGTYNIDTAIDGLTELQPGSFLFMDIDYQRIGGLQNNSVYDDFAPSLFVVATVVSRPTSDLAIVDAGFKAFATDRGYGAVARGNEALTYRFAGDEHGALELKGNTVKLGQRLEFLVPHCDPTVNLYDTLYAVRGERVEGVWPIAARGKSQ